MPNNVKPTKAEKPRLDRQAAKILYILLGANFVVSLNETVLGVALPAVMRDLHITASVGQWLTTAFLLTMAVIIPVTGYLQSRFSTRTLFFAAMGVFTVGTLLGGLSGDFGILLLGRVFQAAGTALLMPMMMTTSMHIIPENMRGAIMGQISLVFAVAPALGPAVSGLVVQAWGWHSLFWLVLPIAILATVIGGKWLHLNHEAGPIRLDFTSLLLSAVGFSGLIYGLSEVGPAVRGEALFNPILAMLPGAFIVIWFVLRQIKLAPKQSALLDLGTFRSHAYRNSILVMAAMMITLFGVIIIVPIYTQNVLHFSALTTGLIMMPGGILQGLLGVVVGKLFDKHGAQKILIPAMAGVAVSIGIMAFFNQGTSVWLVLVAYTLLLVSLGFVFPVLFTTAMGSLPPQLYSHGSATMGVVQQVAGAAGTAGFVAIFTMISGGGATATGDVAGLAAGSHAVFLVGALVALVTLALSFSVKPDARPEGADGAAPEQVVSA